MDTHGRSGSRHWQRLLIVGTDGVLGDLMRRHLDPAGFFVDAAADSAAAEIRITQRAPDVVVVDASVHSSDVLARVRRLGAMPVIVIAGEAASAARLLEDGADDVVHPPIVVEEFCARVRALARRAQGGFRPDEELRIGEDVVLRIDRRCLVLGRDVVCLTPNEFRLVLRLWGPPGRIFSMRELAEAVWGTPAIAGDDAIRAIIKRIRAKMGEARALIRAERGHGYYLSTVWASREEATEHVDA